MISRTTILLTFVFGFALCEIPSFIKVCERSNPDLKGCINNSISEIVPYLKNGIPELNVPPLEPLILDNINLKGNGENGIGATLSELKVYGAANFHISELSPNLKKNLFRFRVHIPKMSVFGKYDTDSKILFINIKGNGPMSMNISDFVFDCAMKGHKVQKESREYLEFDKMKFNIHIGSSKIVLENLFNGDPVLGKATNDVINENIHLFLDEIVPALQNALAEKFTDVANKITLRFTYSELFP